MVSDREKMIERLAREMAHRTGDLEGADKLYRAMTDAELQDEYESGVFEDDVWGDDFEALAWPIEDDDEAI